MLRNENATLKTVSIFVCIFQSWENKKKFSVKKTFASIK